MSFLLNKNNQSEKINSQIHLDYVLGKLLMKKNKSNTFITKLNNDRNLILKKAKNEIIRLI